MKSPDASSTQSPTALAFQRRAERAEALAPTSEAAGGALRFAAGLYRAQATNALALQSIHLSEPLKGDLSRDLRALLHPAQTVLRFIAANGPPVLAQEAQRRGQEGELIAASRLEVCWTGDRPFSEDYLSRALLRVYVEHLAGLKIPPLRPHPQGYCPYCGGPPWIASRRALESTEGAQRFLGCALCGGEWPLVRIRCPSCGEANPDKLPQFGADRYPAVRIEACDTCKRYVKSLDLTVDARPIPEVDELLSLGLDLWAVEQGYSRIEPGLAGV